MEEFEFEKDFDTCKYGSESYYERDTGYAEYECMLLKDGCDPDTCPLNFKCKIER